jgi:hypothetical protein
MSPRSMIKHGAWTRLLGDEHGRLAVTALTGPVKGMRFRLDLADAASVRVFNKWP